jgi:large subunit ribosomal protein L18
VIDDHAGTTVASAGSTEAELRKSTFSGKVRGGNLAGAEALGQVIAERLKAKGITRVVFDRGGNLYHGRVRAVADAARKAGLEF